jgi:hypothetical protein
VSHNFHWQDVAGSQPPTDWVEQLDAAVEREQNREGGPFPAELVAGWLSWYAQRMAELYAFLIVCVGQQHITQRQLEQMTHLARQLSNIIVGELYARSP